VVKLKETLSYYGTQRHANFAWHFLLYICLLAEVIILTCVVFIWQTVVSILCSHCAFIIHSLHKVHEVNAVVSVRTLVVTLKLLNGFRLNLVLGGAH